jgi:hypothetical protein
MSASTWRALVASLVLTSGVAVRAEDPPKQPNLFARYHLNKKGMPPPGKPRHFPNTDERAGYPRALAHHIEPTNTAGGVGYYVGGGVPVGHRHAYADGACRRRDEGTWGWDETGTVHLRHRVILGWSHGYKYQGGMGAYETDGHVVLPDVINATTSKIRSLSRHGEEGEGNEEEHGQE